VKKFLVIIAVFCLVLTISFVGCKTTTTETTAAGTTAAETTVAGTTAAETTVAEETEVTEEKKFGLEDIPEIKNKTAINTIVETGATFDKIVPYVQKFTEKTGVKVNVERVASPVVYSKENVELVAGTGVYDVAYVSNGWTNEWYKYLTTMTDLATQYDPGGVEALNNDMKWHSAVVYGTENAKGFYHVPFYTYHMGMFIRQDVFDDATEQADFKAKYGYDLKAATNFKELRDQAEFFTRKKGALLKGKPLENDLYGVSMMAGAYQINDEFSCYLWGKGQDYATVKKDASGKITEYVITKADQAAQLQAMKEYVELLKFASPGCLTANFDFVVADQGEGRAIIQPTMFSNCFAWTASILEESVVPKDPDAKLGIYPTLGNKPFSGAWGFAVTKATKNPEAAYWFLRYLGSYECQEVVMKEGGQLTTRMDVLADPVWKNADNMYPFGILVDYLLSNWKDQSFVDFITNVYYSSSEAEGKVYEMQMNVLAKGASGELTPEQCIDEVISQTVELTTKFDKIAPISVEK
jgi:multiple sugar transport system substrate-binding protein